MQQVYEANAVAQWLEEMARYVPPELRFRRAGFSAPPDPLCREVHHSMYEIHRISLAYRLVSTAYKCRRMQSS